MAAGPFVCGCEAERCTCVVCPSLWLVSRTSSRDSCSAYPFFSLYTLTCVVVYLLATVVPCLDGYNCYMIYSFDTNCVFRLWGSYPTEPMTCEAHPFFFQVRESRRIHIPPLVPVSAVVDSGPRHQQSKVPTCGALGVCPGLLYLVW